MEKNRILIITSNKKQGQFLGRKLCRAYSNCLPESSVYAACVTNNLKHLKQDVCEKGIKNHHLCSNCLQEDLKEKQKRITELKGKIESNSTKLLQKIQLKKEKIEKEKKKRQNESLMIELKEKKKIFEQNNEKLKKQVDNLKKNIKLEDERIKEYEFIYQEYYNSKHVQFLKKEEKNLGVYSNTKKVIMNELNKKKKLKIKEIMELFPIYKKGNCLCIFSDSIKIPLNFGKLEFDQHLNYSLYYLSLILNLFSFYLNIQIPFEIFFEGTKPFIVYNQKPYSLYLKEEYFQNKEEIESFRISLNLFNDNVLALCHAQGIVVLESNIQNFQINFLSLYHYEHLGATGPFVYYSRTKFVENPQDNYFISKDSIKFIQIEEKEKVNLTHSKNPKGYYLHMDEDYFGEKRKNEIDDEDIQEIKEYN
eukprot:gene1111-10625_t